MTQEIIEMARKSGFTVARNEWVFTEMLVVFAKRVEEKATATEREAFKQIIRETPFSNWFQADVIKAIDKRGQA